MKSTIFALASAPGRAAVAVIRLSGDQTRPALMALGAGLPPPRRASLRKLKGEDGAVLDEALILWMPGPRSFTGEDCAELHLHGGSAVVEAVGARLCSLGLEPAEPGAFTRRAFEAGKLDLVQVEAVADLVDAETEAQRLQALSQLDGAASRLHAAWRSRLTGVLAQLEAAVDFPDEEIPPTVLTEARAEMIALSRELLAASSDRRGERVREGFRVALLGPPNVGKSSLFNALLGRDAAIVTDIPGTTRDVIEAEMVIAGRRVILADLAGLRESEDVVEREGVRRAIAWGDGADLRLYLRTTGVPGAADEARDLHLLAKADTSAATEAGLRVSAATGEGLSALKAEIERRLLQATSSATAPAATRQRHRAALLDAATRLQQAAGEGRPEVACEDVRLAARALARLTGQIGTEDILGAVFSTFCIGK